MGKFKKGDTVGVVADAFTQYMSVDGKAFPGQNNIHIVHRPEKTYSSTVKCLFRREFESPQRGMVIGYKRKATGYYYGGGLDASWDRYYEEPPSLDQDKRHLLVVVESLDGDYFSEPWLCLEDDLELVDIK